MRIPFQLCTTQATSLSANRSQATFQVSMQSILLSARQPLHTVGVCRLSLVNHMISGAFAPTLIEALTYQGNAMCVLLKGPKWVTVVSDSNHGSERRCMMVRAPSIILNRANEAFGQLFLPQNVVEEWRVTIVLPQQVTSSIPSPIAFAGALAIPTHTLCFELEFLPNATVPMPITSPNAQLVLSTLDIQNNGRGLFLNATRTSFEFRGIDLRAVMGRPMWERYSRFNLKCICIVGCPLSTTVVGEMTTSIAILSGLDFGPRNTHTQLPIAQSGVLLGQTVWTTAAYFVGNTPDQLSPPHTFRKGSPFVNLRIDNFSIPSLLPLDTATFQSYDAPNGCLAHQLFLLRFDGVEEE